MTLEELEVHFCPKEQPLLEPKEIPANSFPPVALRQQTGDGPYLRKPRQKTLSWESFPSMFLSFNVSDHSSSELLSVEVGTVH